MIDISDQIAEDDMPVCPMCDNAILEFEEAVLVFANGAKAIAHSMCCDWALSDEILKGRI